MSQSDISSYKAEFVLPAELNAERSSLQPGTRMSVRSRVRARKPRITAPGRETQLTFWLRRPVKPAASAVHDWVRQAWSSKGKCQDHTETAPCPSQARFHTLPTITLVLMHHPDWRTNTESPMIEEDAQSNSLAQSSGILFNDLSSPPCTSKRRSISKLLERCD
jgi:hypothetical protein